MEGLTVQQGKVFDVIGAADAVIAKWAEQYLPLKIKGIEDKAGQKKVHEARMVVKTKRIEVEKKRKELKEDALRYGQAIDKEANRIKGLIEPIETHLEAEEKAVDDALEAIRLEKVRLEELRIQARRDRLVALGISFNGQMWSYGAALNLPEALLKVANDEQFEKHFSQFSEAVEADKVRQATEEAARKAEAERLAKVAAEQEAERKRLEAIAKEQAEKEAAAIAAEQERLKAIAEEERKARIRENLERDAREKAEAALRAEERRVADEKAEWERIKAEELRAQEAAKQKIIDDARHAEELAKAKAEAAEKARLQAIEDAKKEAAAKAEAERLAKIAAEKKAAKRPDREKLAAWATEIDNICRNCPAVKSPEAVDIANSTKESIGRALKVMADMVEELL